MVHTRPTHWDFSIYICLIKTSLFTSHSLTTLACEMGLFLCFFFFLVISSASACDRCVHQAKVAYFSKASALSCKDSFSLILVSDMIIRRPHRFMIKKTQNFPRPSWFFWEFCCGLSWLFQFDKDRWYFEWEYTKTGIDPDDIFPKYLFGCT